LVRQDEQKRRAAKKRREAAPAGEDKKQEAYDVVLETLNALIAERGAEEKIWGSMVKQALKRRKPGFNESYYGFRAFSDLLEQRLLLKSGSGITNPVSRAAATRDELAPVEFVSGRRRLAAKLRSYRPASVAFLGVDAYRHAFGQPKVAIGRQPETFEGAEIWVLPNPSGLNANYQLAALARLFRALRKSTALRNRGGGDRSSRCAATPPCSGPRTRSRSRSRARSSRTR